MMHSYMHSEIFMKGALMSSFAASGPAAGVCSFYLSDTAGGSGIFGFPQTFNSTAFPAKESEPRCVKK